MTVVMAEITANVWQVRTEVGAHVESDDELVIPESMKTKIPDIAPSAGKVTEIRVELAGKVTEGDVIAVVEP